MQHNAPPVYSDAIPVQTSKLTAACNENYLSESALRETVVLGSVSHLQNHTIQLLYVQKMILGLTNVKEIVSPDLQSASLDFVQAKLQFDWQ